MITPEQEKWLGHLPNNNVIRIYPYNPESKKVFEKLKIKIMNYLREDIKVELHGSTAFEISGQGELDINIPVPPEKFNEILEELKEIFGKPGSVYASRARFVAYIDGIKAEIMLVNEQSDDWLNLIKLEQILTNDPDILSSYEKMKISADGLSTQAYYRKKTEFINKLFNKNIPN